MSEEESVYLQNTSCESCGSSDANGIWSDSGTYCFSCQATGKIEEEDLPFKELAAPVDISFVRDLPTRGFAERKITMEIADFFDVKVKQNGDVITDHFYPYTKEGEIVGYKQRTVEGKQFKAIGVQKGTELFGQSKFNSGGKKLVITEGEIDAMTVAQAYKKDKGVIWPVVSIPNGAASQKAILANLDWIRSFNEVILMFDGDEAGRAGVEKAAKMIGADKVRVANLKHKDPSDSYVKSGPADILNQTWNALRYSPAGIISDVSEIKKQYLEDREAVYIPFPDFVAPLNDKIFGRRLGSITMFTSGTGCGKTTFLREDAYHLFNTTEETIGVCSLEESISETTRGFVSMHINKRVGIPGQETEWEEEEKAIDELFGSGRFLMLDHQGSVSDNSLIEKIQFMAASGCSIIYLDHATIAVSETDGDVNRAMDKLMSDLLKICKQFNCWIGLVSHLRKTGNGQESFEDGGDISLDALKGSGSLKQISAQVIALSRNLNAEDESERHTIKVNVLKCRFSGSTGPACRYSFSKNGRLKNSKAPIVNFAVLGE